MTPTEKEKGHLSERISYLKEKKMSSLEPRTKISGNKKENKLPPNPNRMQKMSSAIFLIFVLLVNLLMLTISYDFLELQNALIENEDTNHLKKEFILAMKNLWKNLNKGATGIAKPSGGSLHKPQNPLTPPPLPPTQHTPPPVSPEKPQTRDMATWRTFKRSAEPKKGPYPPMEKDPETGFYIMNPIDYSGFNHICLNDHDYKSNTFFMVHGSFTTSPSPLNGNKPVFIDSITLEGQEKYQYLHVYPEPLLIRIEHTNGMDFTTMFLPPNATIDSILAEARKLQATKEYIKDELNNY